MSKCGKNKKVQILQTNITQLVQQTVRRITNEILVQPARQSTQIVISNFFKKYICFLIFFVPED